MEKKGITVKQIVGLALVGLFFVIIVRNANKSSKTENSNPLNATGKDDVEEIHKIKNEIPIIIPDKKPAEKVTENNQNLVDNGKVTDEIEIGGDADIEGKEGILKEEIITPEKKQAQYIQRAIDFLKSKNVPIDTIIAMGYNKDEHIVKYAKDQGWNESEKQDS